MQRLAESSGVLDSGPEKVRYNGLAVSELSKKVSGLEMRVLRKN
jgi:hypothetical protein